MLTADTAAAVAKRHGLSLADAASLRALADDEAEADKIAAQFAGSDQGLANRDFVRALFAEDEPTAFERPNAKETP